MRYFVYWINMLKDKQGYAPMRAIDTTTKAKAYLQGFADSILTHIEGLDKVSIKKEYKIKEKGVKA